MGRDLRILAPIEQSLTLFGFDVETTTEQNIFYMGSIVGENYTTVWYKKEDMITEIIRLRSLHSDAVFTATNLQFDIFALLEGTEYICYLEPVVRGSRIIGGYFRPDEETIELRDTLSYFPVALRTLGELVGIPKLETPTCLGRVPENEKERRELEVYNVQDSLITYTFMVQFHAFMQSLGAKLQMTTASSSFDVFRRKYLPCDMIANTMEECLFAFKAYRGGRTEVYRRGPLPDDGKEYACYDFNSMYPYVMREYVYPHPNFLTFIKKPTEYHINECMGVSEVTITCPKEMFLPYLGLTHNDTFVFPTGTMRGVWTHFEIWNALELGYTLEKIHKTLISTSTWQPFTTFVDDFYAMRQRYKEQGDLREKFVKLLLNSLYGRLGMRLYDRKVYHESMLTCEELQKHIDEGYVDEWVGENEEWIYLVKETLQEKDIVGSVQPIIAAHIAAFARHELYTAQKTAEETLLYSDTDSLFCAHAFETSSVLGALDKEAVLTDALFVRPKFYWYQTPKKNVTKIKGVQGLHARENATELFEKTVTDPTFTHHATRFTKFFASNRKHHGAYRKVNSIYSTTKTLQLEDTKRWWPKAFNPEEHQVSRPRHKKLWIDQKLED